ncbi:hypothetical protein ACJ41O_012363 [Fusarium nematophilum]
MLVLDKQWQSTPGEQAEFRRGGPSWKQIGTPSTSVVSTLGLDETYHLSDLLMISQSLEDAQPPETLREFISFCGKDRPHFISDEINAKSIFTNPNIPDSASFTSSLALNTEGQIDPKLFHVLYGASKDFCANGLQLGLVCCKNQGIFSAMSSISIFSWSPHVIQDVWAFMLNDRQWIIKFMDKKLIRMTEHYTIATRFLRDHGIPY